MKIDMLSCSEARDKVLEAAVKQRDLMKKVNEDDDALRAQEGFVYDLDYSKDVIKKLIEINEGQMRLEGLCFEWVQSLEKALEFAVGLVEEGNLKNVKITGSDITFEV